MTAIRLTALLVGSIAGASLVVAPVAAQTILIRNAQIHTVAQAGVIEDGDVLVRNGLIAAIGEGLTAPDGASIIDGRGKIVTPGFFAAYSQLGLAEIGLDREANDSRPESNYPVSASLDALDAFNPTATAVAISRAGGVTRAFTAPHPGGKIFAGRGAVIDLSERSQVVTKPQAAQLAVLGFAGSSRSGNTRLGAVATMRETLDEAIAYHANPRDYLSRRPDARFIVNDLKALGPVIAGRQPLIISAHSAVDIRAALRIKADYRLQMVIMGAAEGWRVARELASSNTPVILDPLDNLPQQFEMLGATLANAARLNEAGVQIAFLAPETPNLRLLPQSAGNAVANGLPHSAAIAALTINPARIFGLDARFGSVELGKVADLVVWDGDPLEVTSRPVEVLIDGRPASLENRQTKLRDRYRDLERRDLPFAYRGD